MSENKNYNDKDAVAVKNPIADALDRLTAEFTVPSSDGGESAKDYVKLTLESDFTGASNSTIDALYNAFYSGGGIVEAIPVHFAEGYMYKGEYDYNQKTIVIDPLKILLDGGGVECYVDRNVLFMLRAIPEFVEGVTFSSDYAPTEALVGVYVKTEVTGATIDSEGYFNPVARQVTPLIDFSTAEDEVTISMVVIDPDDPGPN